MTQLKTRNISLPSHRLPQSSTFYRTWGNRGLVNFLTLPSAAPENKTREAETGLPFPKQCEPPNSELLPLALRSLLVGGGVDTKSLERKPKLWALDC